MTSGIASESAPAASLAIAWRTIQDRLFGSTEVRFASKVTLGAMLAFYVSQTINLENPSWSVTTVMVLMMAQYVGAIVEKAVFRLLGTFAGGTAAVLITGNFIENGFFYLAALCPLLIIATYFYGGTRVPYAFYLFAFTAVIVCSDAFSTPEQVVSIAMARVLEICVGILCAVLVTVLVWPRHAAKEFRDQVVATLERLKKMIISQATEEIRSAMPVAPDRSAELAYSAGFTRLRQLLHFATQENGRYSEREADFLAMLSAVNALRSSGLTLMMRPTANRELIEELRPEFEAIVEALSHDFDVAIRNARRGSVPRPSLEPVYLRFSERLHVIREEGRTRSLPIGDLSQMCQLYLTLSEVRSRLDNLHAALDAINADAVDASRPGLAKAKLAIDPIWLRAGIRGAIAFPVALMFNQWLMPPGPGLVAILAWAFTAKSHMFAYGEGDQRAFLRAGLCWLGAAPAILVLVACWPLMSSSLGISVFLACSLFVRGYLTHSQTGQSFWSYVSLFLISGTLGLQADESVTFDAIVNLILGVALGVTVGAVVQRLIFPVLPHTELRRSFASYFGLIERIFPFEQRVEQVPRPVLNKLALIPNKCRAWIDVLHEPSRSHSVRSELNELIENLHELNCSTQALRRALLRPFASTIVARVKPVFDEFDAWIRPAVNGIQTALSTGRPLSPMENTGRLLGLLEERIRELREAQTLRSLSTEELIHFFAVAERYQAILEDITMSRDRLVRSKIAAWAGDYVL